MGKASRDKGARGEREAVKALAAFGVKAVRTAPMQAGWADQFGDIAIEKADARGRLEDGRYCSKAHQFLRIEVKRAERPNPDAALTECQSHFHEEALVMYRRNNQEWRVCLSLEDLFGLLRSDNYAGLRGGQ